jgi:uroporphyrin-III C-methyltransferase
MEQYKEKKITLVGAGPGDPELITLKGLKAIENAEVILYDALVNEELLLSAPNAVKVFVGKRNGKKAFSQSEINELLVYFAIRYDQVVRLKGGDSFVFGRGFEEIQFAEKHGIKTEVIPGISSAISVPALAGIPVTHRGVSKSFHVVTATLSDGKMNPDLEHVSLGKGTVLVLMGLHLLSEIAQLYIRNGKSTQSAAIILDGSLPTEELFIGTIESLPAQFKNPDLKPGIIVIGDVVQLKKAEILLNKELANLCLSQIKVN